MSSSPLMKSPPRGLMSQADIGEAREQLSASRERLLRQVAEAEQAIEEMFNWRTVIKRHPVATFVGAFAVGYALARLFSRK